MSDTIPSVMNEERHSGPLIVTDWLSLISYEWPSCFKTGQLLDYANENTHYALQWDEDQGETLAQFFMPDPAEPESYDSQTDQLDEFCHGATFEALAGKKDLVAIALVDQGSFDESGVWQRRENHGPLTAFQLGHVLGRDRFKLRLSSNHQPGECTTYLALSAPGNNIRASKGEPDAERRLIFVVDPDPDSICALMSTVSENMAFALRAAISRHLAFNPLVAATYTWKGMPKFRLAFHLPYHALRRADKAIEHPHQLQRLPLRHTEDVSFLRNDGSRWYLYEAQISCVVAGFDDWRWDAYLFVDTYFQSEDEKRPESVSDYYEESEAECGMYHDPHSRGKLEAKQPLGNPRDYFLTVLQYRLQQIKNEWQPIVNELKHSMRRYEQTEQHKVSGSKKHRTLKDADDHFNDLQEALNFTRKARQLSKKLLPVLENTIKIWAKCSFRPAGPFQDLRNPIHGPRPTPIIQESMEELEASRQTLAQVAVQCEDFARDLELHLNHAAMEVSIHQRQLAQDNKTLSVVMILFISPIALTAAVFSMPVTILPVLQRDSHSFITSTLVLALIGVVVTWAQSLLLRLWHSFLTSIRAHTAIGNTSMPMPKWLRALGTRRMALPGLATKAPRTDVESQQEIV